VKKYFVLVPAVVLSVSIAVPLSAQERERRRQPDQKQGQGEQKKNPETKAEPRQDPPPKAGQPAERGVEQTPGRARAGQGERNKNPEARPDPRRDPPPSQRRTEPQRRGEQPPDRGIEPTPGSGRAGQGNRGYVDPPNRPSPPRDYAVPRGRPHPRPHPQFGPYHSRMYQGRLFYWRPYLRHWRYPNTCVSGYWEWDRCIEHWVWVEGYCNVRGHRHRFDPGFYFWFQFGR